MDTQDFSDPDWREVLDEFRLLVQRAGYAGWDAAMVSAIDEQQDDRDAERAREPVRRDALDDLRHYAREFMIFLKSRSRWTLDEASRQLASILYTEERQPVGSVTVAFGEEQRSLYERTDEIDAMINDLRQFVDELHGEDTEFWDDTDDGSGGGE